MEPLGINPVFLLAQILNFLVLALLLRRFAYKPVLDMLEKRRKRVEQGLEDARLAEEARANAESEKQQILEQARTEAQGIVIEAKRRGEAEAAEALEKTRGQTEAILDEARTEALAERDRLLGEMRGQIAALAIAAAHQLVGEALDERRQMQLVAEFFSGLKADQVKVADEVGALTGGEAVVTSALPLSEMDRATYRAYLQAQLGAEVNVEFKTDPSILGGVVLRVGDVIVDDSVIGKMDRLQQKLS